MELIDEKIQAYAEQFSTPEDELLAEIARETYAHHEQSNMLSGHVQGKFLEILSAAIKPLRILEVGTFVGYSTLCLAKGLLKNGQIHTIELRKQEADLANSYFSRSIYRDKIILHRGNALEVIPSLNEEWDLVFIDADKPGYIDYYQLVLPRVKPGGLILADNVLFHGEVLEEPVTGKSAKAIQAFNEYVQQDAGVDKVLLTVRDGLLLILKK